MSNQDEESQQPKLPAYQFYSADLNYNYYTEQSSDAPNAVTGSTVGTTSTTSGGVDTTQSRMVPNAVTGPAGAASSSSLPTSSLPSLKLPPLPPLPALPVPKSIGSSSIAADASRSSISHASRSSTGGGSEFPPKTFEPTGERGVPNKVEYSLIDDGPEPTFEERVAAMKRATAAEEAPAPVVPPPSTISFPTAEQLPPVQRLAPVEQFPPVEQVPALARVSAPQKSDEEWNSYEAPNCVPDVFSPDFNFNRSLLKIFWRIDIDHNNRVCKNELLTALSNDWFAGDERLLAKLMYEIYEDISPETIFCDAGLSINNILDFELFADLAARDAQPTRTSATPAPGARLTPKNPSKSNTKSSKSLRRLFNGR